MTWKRDTAKKRVLAVLQNHPLGIRSDRLTELANTPRSQARIGELRNMGHNIETSFDPSSTLAVYTLVGSSPPKRVACAAYHVHVYENPNGGYECSIKSYDETKFSGGMSDADRNTIMEDMKSMISVSLDGLGKAPAAPQTLADPKVSATTYERVPTREDIFDDIFGPEGE